jgi:hypothetical protein
MGKIMEFWIWVGIITLAFVVVTTLASRRQRLHGGSRRAEHGKLGQSEKSPDEWWFSEPREDPRRRRWRPPKA